LDTDTGSLEIGIVRYTTPTGFPALGQSNHSLSKFRSWPGDTPSAPWNVRPRIGRLTPDQPTQVPAPGLGCTTCDGCTLSLSLVPSLDLPPFS